MKRWLGALSKITLGVALGLCVAEWAFSLRDQDAFAHVNFYQPDPTLGVRLRPHAHMRIAFSGNPVTKLRTNARGFRGSEWGAAAPRDVLVVGDSQVFGLGVNEGDTFSAKLQAALGGHAHMLHVLNAGVPTYGPLEYTTLVERLTAERKPDAVVYVLNMSNDLFELGRPNLQRHAVWDGWAVRKETAPTSAVEFPFRGWLMSQSHLVYALRRLWYGETSRDPAFASEGTWQDLSSAAHTHVPAKVPNDEQVRHVVSQRQALASKLLGVEAQLFERFSAGVEKKNRAYGAAVKDLAGYPGNPRDILLNHYAEESRPISETAYQLVGAALAVAKNDAAFATLAETSHDSNMLELLRERKALREQLATTTEAGSTDARDQDPLDAMLARTRRACDAVNARLLVVALPLDVQVSKQEWLKYGPASKPIDMSTTLALNQDVVRRSERQGALALDALPALAAAEPGAFLAGDLHMSAKGHAALAQAIAHVLTTAQPARGALPPGRSFAVHQAEWDAASPVASAAAEAAGCSLKHVREWWQVRCSGTPMGVELLQGGRGEAYASIQEREFFGLNKDVFLTFPLLEHDVLEARFASLDGTRTVRAAWRPDATTPTLLFGALIKGESKDGILPGAIEETGMLERCAAWDRTSACADDQLAFGALGCCVPRCSPDHPCQTGRCALWNGERGCIEP